MVRTVSDLVPLVLTGIDQPATRRVGTERYVGRQPDHVGERAIERGCDEHANHEPARPEDSSRSPSTR